MGRSILIVVLLISTIYAGIIINVQREMYKLPLVIRDHFITKEGENVSDYALRAAVRLGTEQPEFRMPIDVDTITYYFDGKNLTNHFPLYQHSVNGINYNISKIHYSRDRAVDEDFYEAQVTITRPKATSSDPDFTYTSQIGYSYGDHNVDGPLVLYGDYGAQFHIPEVIEDQSPQDPPTEGYMFGIGSEHTQFLRLEARGVWGNGSGHKSFVFGHSNSSNNDNGHVHRGAGIQTPNPTNPANYETILNRLKQYNQFSISFYSKIERLSNSQVNQGWGQNGTGGNIVNNGGNCGTLLWYASDPYHSLYNQPGYTRPSIAIWYDNYRTSNPNRYTVTMHYGITIDDGTTNGTYYEITKTGVPTLSNTNQGDWHMYTITFLNGTLTAYYDKDVVGTLSGLGGSSIKPNDYGFTIGVRDIRADASRVADSIYVHGRVAGVDEYKATSTNYMFYNGLIDYYSFWDVALTPQQIEDWFNSTIGKTVKSYIRD